MGLLKSTVKRNCDAFQESPVAMCLLLELGHSRKCTGADTSDILTLGMRDRAIYKPELGHGSMRLVMINQDYLEVWLYSSLIVDNVNLDYLLTIKNVHKLCLAVQARFTGNVFA